MKALLIKFEVTKKISASQQALEVVQIRKGWKSPSAAFINRFFDFVLVLSSISLLLKGKKQSAFEPKLLSVKG